VIEIFRSKIKFLVKYRYFGQKSKLWSNTDILAKNRNFGLKKVKFGQKSIFLIIEIENKVKIKKISKFVFAVYLKIKAIKNLPTFLDLNRDEINVEAMTELQKQLTSIEVERDMVTDQLCELERRLNQEQEKFNLRSQLADDKLAVSNQEKEMIKEQSSKLSQFVSTLTAENEKLVNDRDIIRKVVFSLV